MVDRAQSFEARACDLDTNRHNSETARGASIGLSSKQAQQAQASWAETVMVLFLGLVVCVIATSSQSYWIDEAVTVRRTITPGLADLWRELHAEGNANLQVPLYFLFAWCWEKVTGPTEFGMRAGNWLWFLLGLLTAIRAVSGKRVLFWAISLVLLTSAFAWYYIDEARPYALQLAASLMVFGSSYQILSWNDASQTQRSWIAVLCFGSVLLAASGLLAMVWLGGFLAAALISRPIKHWIGLLRVYPKSFGVTVFLLGALAVYYLWTMGIGARATYGRTTPVTISFILYELLGFSGLGPGRLELREIGARALLPWLPMLAAFALSLFFILIKGCRRVVLDTSLRTRLSWTVTLLLVAAFVVGMSAHSQFRILGRHCMPLLPLFLALLGLGIADRLAQRKLADIIFVSVFLAFSLSSCLELRFCKRHSKDDYRSAVALAQRALSIGELVWWSADLESAALYGLPLAESGRAGKSATIVVNPAKQFEGDALKPDLVITSRPDKYDAYGMIGDYLRKTGFQVKTTFQAFTVWQKPAN